MSLSLEVRKFTNSEHIGDFITVTLPGELPVGQDEIRTVRRDKAAAERASREARAREDAERLALSSVTEAEADLKRTKEELAQAEAKLAECTKNHEALLPDFNDKKAAMDAAKKEFSAKKAESDKLEAEQSSAEAKLNSIKKNRQDAEKRAEDNRAALEKARGDCTAATAEEGELSAQLDKEKSELAEAEGRSKNSIDAAEAMVRLETASLAEFNSLKDESVSLSVEKRVLEKQLAEAQISETRAGKDHQKAQADRELAEKQYEALRSADKKRDSEKDAMRLAQAKSRFDTAEAEERVRFANYEKEQDFLKATQDKLAACEQNITENTGKLAEATKRLDESKKNSRKANETMTAEGLRLSEQRSKVETVSSKLETARGRIAALKKAQEEASAAITSAEAEIESAKPLIESAEAEYKEKKQVYDAAKAVTDNHEKIFSEKRSEFDKISTRTDEEKRALDAAATRRGELKDRITAIELHLVEARNKLEDAQENSRSAISEAQRLNANIHVIETKYETARMHYLESGKGEPIILIHTAGQSLYTFRSLFYKLAMSYRVIAIDLMGHGYSDHPDFFDYELREHAESIVRFMDAMDIEYAHLLGFSMGAGFALELAKLHPDRVGRVVAISPGGITGSMPLSVRMIESGLFGPLASRLYRVRSVEKMLNECVFDHTVIGPHDVKEYFRPASTSDGRYAIRRTVSGFDEDELAASLREIEAPVLIIWGDDDKWHPVDGSGLYRSSIPNAALTIVRNAGHLVHEEKPDRIYELVRSFIPAGYGSDD